LRAGVPGTIADSGLGRATVVVGSESAVRFTAGSVVDLVGGSNANGSTLRVRLPEEQVLAAIGGAQALRFDGQLSGVRRVLVEGYRQYNVDGVIADAEVAAGPGNPWYSAATSFVDSTIGRGTAVGLAPTQQVSFTPGIDVAADGDLLLLSDWNLAAWQYRGVAPTLTVRASGDFMLAASISDGFTSVAEDASGFTLIEVLLTIIVLSIIMIPILAWTVVAFQRSADPYYTSSSKAFTELSRFIDRDLASSKSVQRWVPAKAATATSPAVAASFPADPCPVDSVAQTADSQGSGASTLPNCSCSAQRSAKGSPAPPSSSVR
jgi:prepilin-type N-terminal cleavage/methylation domain-containing protein